MALDKNKVDEMLIDFVMRNDALLVRNKEENPKVYNAVIDALALLSERFGEGTTFRSEAPVVEEEEVEEKSPTVEEPKVEAPKLDFEVNDVFYHKDDKGTKYYIYDIVGDEVFVGFRDKDKRTVKYPLFKVKSLFKNGTWVLTGNKYVGVAPMEEAPKPTATKSEAKKEATPPPPSPTPTPEPQESDEPNTEQEIKEAIQALKPLVKFDPDVALEINKLKDKLKALKKKKA